MRVIIDMAMQTTLMDQLHVLLKGASRGQWAFKLPSLVYSLL